MGIVNSWVAMSLEPLARLLVFKSQFSHLLGMTLNKLFYLSVSQCCCFLIYEMGLIVTTTTTKTTQQISDY